MDGTTTATEIVDQVFLTPRVLDARAFHEYSATLQDLLKEAVGRQNTLKLTSTEIETLRGQARDAANDLNRRLETAVRVIPGIDQRLAKVEQLVSDANRILNVDPAQKIAEMQTESRRVITEAMASLDTRLTDLLQTALLQARSHADEISLRGGKLEIEASRIADEFNTRIRVLADRLLQQTNESQGIFDSQARLYDDRLTRRAEELETRMHAQVQGFERSLDAKLQQLETRLAHFESQIAGTVERHATAAIGSVIERATQAEHQALETISQTMTRLQAYEQLLLKRIEHAATASEVATKSLRDLLDQTLPRLEHAHTESNAISDRLSILLSTARDFVESEDGGVAIREFRQIAQRLDTIRADTDFSMRQLQDICRQTEVARTSLGDTLLTAAADCDRLLARADDVSGRNAALESTLSNIQRQTEHVSALAATVGHFTERREDLEACAARISGMLEGVERKKIHLEDELRQTGTLLDAAETMLTERYNQLAAAVKQGSELGATLQTEIAACRATFTELQTQQAQISERYGQAYAQVDGELAGRITTLLTSTRDAALRLDELVSRAEDLQRKTVARASAPVAASSIFPTAR